MWGVWIFRRDDVSTLETHGPALMRSLEDGWSFPGIPAVFKHQGIEKIRFDLGRPLPAMSKQAWLDGPGQMVAFVTKSLMSAESFLDGIKIGANSQRSIEFQRAQAAAVRSN